MSKNDGRPMDALSRFAHAVFTLPEGWRWSVAECLNPPKFRRLEGYVHTGRRFLSGPRKGALRPRDMVPGTYSVWTYNQSDFEDWARAYERATGRCHDCDGAGEFVNGDSTYKCYTCEGEQPKYLRGDRC